MYKRYVKTAFKKLCKFTTVQLYIIWLSATVQDSVHVVVEECGQKYHTGRQSIDQSITIYTWVYMPLNSTAALDLIHTTLALQTKKASLITPDRFSLYNQIIQQLQTNHILLIHSSQTETYNVIHQELTNGQDRAGFNVSTNTV